MSIMLDNITLEFVGTPIEGPQGPPGAASNAVAAVFVENETPIGLINGVNCSFITRRTPVPGSVKVHSDGLRLVPTTDPAIPRDYVIVGGNIQLLTPPTTTLIVDYRVKDDQ